MQSHTHNILPRVLEGSQTSLVLPWTQTNSIIIVSLTDYVLYAKHSAEHIICLTSFNPHNNYSI